MIFLFLLSVLSYFILFPFHITAGYLTLFFFVCELTCICICVCVRGECTESLRRRISELETECKKLTLDIKVKEDQIRELELKVQVRRFSCYICSKSALKKCRKCNKIDNKCLILLSCLSRNFINIRKTRRTQRFWCQRCQRCRIKPSTWKIASVLRPELSWTSSLPSETLRDSWRSHKVCITPCPENSNISF